MRLSGRETEKVSVQIPLAGGVCILQALEREHSVPNRAWGVFFSLGKRSWVYNSKVDFFSQIPASSIVGIAECRTKAP